MSDKIAIVGSGLIGSCWATLFASAGFKVCLYDISEQHLNAAKERVASNLLKLESQNLLRGPLSTTEALQNVDSTICLKTALDGAVYAQESTCETVDFKRKIFSEMDELADPGCILASSTSTIPSSKFTAELRNRSRCLVAHPVNPPLYLRLVEVVPAEWTDSTVVDRTCEIMKKIGQEPIRLQKEVLGFAVNRMQFALMAEAWRLVKDDVLSPEDVDKVMSAGLGPRYAFYGPLQTIHMNADGIRDYCDRYGAGVRNVLADLGPMPTFDEPEVLEKVEAALMKELPLETLSLAKQERESNLAKLEVLKMDNNNKLNNKD